MDLLAFQRKYLSPKIKLLGDILGEVIVEQAGNDLLELEEKIRLSAKEFREDDNLNAFGNLEFIINGLSNEQRLGIIQSFSLFFQLANLAEEDYRIAINRQLNKDQKGLLDNVIKTSKQQGLQLSQLITILREIKIKFVWTAHPTEARRLTNLIKLREIYKTMLSPDLTPKQIRHEIKRLITLIWQSDDIREEKVHILDEVRNTLFYFDTTVFSSLPELMSQISDQIEMEYGERVILPNFLEFGSWVGGDRDGHPGVTSEITIQTLLLQKRLCLRKYRESIHKLIQSLSSSTNKVGISKELEESIEEDTKALPLFANSTIRLNEVERYRRKLDFIRLKIENTLEEVESIAVDVGLGRTLVGARGEIEIKSDKNKRYIRSSELLDDLMIIDRSLRSNKGEIIADGLLATLLQQVRIFGFHLSSLDLRQHSQVHNNAINEIFDQISLPTLNSLSFDQKISQLHGELINQRPLGVNSFVSRCSKATQELLQTLEIAHKSLILISPRSIESYVISMTRDEIDILTLMLLMKEIDLIEIKENKIIRANLDIVPLFETREDLLKAPDVMDRLFRDDLYLSYLQSRDMIQEIMIGYSDSGKDAGLLQSNYRLLIAQLSLLRVANEHQIKLRIFHGRGGSVSRGGGPSHKALLGIPFAKEVKITEQGEVIGWNYSNKKIAKHHLEQMISAMIERAVTHEENTTFDEGNKEYLDIFEKLADDACTTYEQLVKNDQRFIPFYLSFTPLDSIERATIGSRPSRRTAGSASSIAELRAIPWVFSWMQTRALFPAFFGTGNALSSFIDENGSKILHEMYQKWTFFTSLVDNMQMVMIKTDFNIASKYLELVHEHRDVYDIIKEDFDKAKKAILEITAHKILLGHAPDLRNSLLRRNTYIDPLHLIQISLLKEWRKSDRPEDMKPTGILRELLQTQNGIAAGLRNTG